MKTSICTLYEGNYHLGVGALINSLIVNGFNGDIYVGYRGHLPSWLRHYQKTDLESWKQAPYVRLSNGSIVYFLSLQTNIHLTNYKPQFLIDLTTGVCKNNDAIAYFDPDIVVCRHWEYFEDWMQHGVAVVHDIIMDDMPSTHPLRRNWEYIALQKGYAINNHLNAYVNAGFCGIHKEYWAFLPLWKSIIDIALNEFNANPNQLRTHPRPHPFLYPDQDAMNLSLMVFKGRISEIGPEGMGFRYGVVAMAHSVGVPKPWDKKIITSFLSGNRPTFTEKKYWQYVNGPVKMYSKFSLSLIKFKLNIFAFLGRFYSRN